jgi:membrane protein
MIGTLPFGGERYNSGIMLHSLATKLRRTLTRVIPQCNMISQAVAFNMFLAFFAILLIALGLMKGSLEGQSGQDLAIRLAGMLPPGSWQLVSETLLRPEVNSWYLALIGWVGTLMEGAQMMKLILKGIAMIYGDTEGHPFFGRQLLGVLLFSVACVVWFAVIALTLFGGPIGQWIAPRPGEYSLAHAIWPIISLVLTMILKTFVLALIYRFARPVETTWRSILPGAVVVAILWWGFDVLFEIYVRKTQYGPVYGGLAAVIGLLVWMEFSAMLIFIGAAWNAENAEKTAPAPI